MDRLTEAQRSIAANMIDTGRVILGKGASDDYVAAAAFVFDNGVFWLSAQARSEVAKMLRTALENSHDDG